MKITSLLLTLIFIFSILDSCDSVNKSCSGGFTVYYYDYASLELSESSFTPDEGYFYFEIAAGSVETVSKLDDINSFGSGLMADDLMTEALYSIKELLIASNLPFDSTNPENLDLLIYLELYYGGKWQKIENPQFYEMNSIVLRCSKFPDNLDESYSITASIEKSNGKVVTGSLKGLSF